MVSVLHWIEECSYKKWWVVFIDLRMVNDLHRTVNVCQTWWVTFVEVEMFMLNVVNAVHRPSEYSYQSRWMACSEPRIVYDKPCEWPSQRLWMLYETWWVASAELRSVRWFYMYLCISEVFRRTNYAMKFIYILRLLFTGMWHCIELLDCFCQYAATFLILCLWFSASLIYVNNCPTRCNTKQCIYYSASSLYMFRVSNIYGAGGCSYSFVYSWWWVWLTPETWRVNLQKNK